MHPNPGNVNIRLAWEGGEEETPIGTQMPVAVQPTVVHQRMPAQKSRFTIHGRVHEPLRAQVDDRVVRKYSLDESKNEEMTRDLRILGITETAAYPDLDGLARELESLF